MKGTGRFHGVTKFGQCSNEGRLDPRSVRAPRSNQLKVPAKVAPAGAETVIVSTSCLARSAATRERAYVPEPAWFRLGNVMSNATRIRASDTGDRLQGRPRQSLWGTYSAVGAPYEAVMHWQHKYSQGDQGYKPPKATAGPSGSQVWTNIRPDAGTNQSVEDTELNDQLND